MSTNTGIFYKREVYYLCSLEKKHEHFPSSVNQFSPLKEKHVLKILGSKMTKVYKLIKKVNARWEIPKLGDITVPGAWHKQSWDCDHVGPFGTQSSTLFLYSCKPRTTNSLDLLWCHSNKSQLGSIQQSWAKGQRPWIKASADDRAQTTLNFQTASQPVRHWKTLYTNVIITHFPSSLTHNSL